MKKCKIERKISNLSQIEVKTGPKINSGGWEITSGGVKKNVKPIQTEKREKAWRPLE